MDSFQEKIKEIEEIHKKEISELIARNKGEVKELKDKIETSERNLHETK